MYLRFTQKTPLIAQAIQRRNVKVKLTLEQAMKAQRGEEV